MRNNSSPGLKSTFEEVDTQRINAPQNVTVDLLLRARRQKPKCRQLLPVKMYLVNV